MKIKLFGLIGYPLEHSFSESYFKEKFIREGIENCIYKNFEVSLLEDFIDKVRSNNSQNNYNELEGFNVTMPFKEEIIPYLDFLDKEAKEASAKAAEEMKKDPKKEIPKHYFTMMKELTLTGFFTSEVGATKALRYVAVPGKFEGSVPYTKGEKAWATS